MIDITHDLEADAVYISLARGRIDATDEIAPNAFVDRDSEGKIVGIEILTASKVLAPGSWQQARMPGNKDVEAAE
jgi:uncharacterized protein YuzE